MKTHQQLGDNKEYTSFFSQRDNILALGLSNMEMENPQFVDDFVETAIYRLPSQVWWHRRVDVLRKPRFWGA